MARRPIWLLAVLTPWPRLVQCRATQEEAAEVEAPLFFGAFATPIEERGRCDPRGAARSCGCR